MILEETDLEVELDIVGWLVELPSWMGIAIEREVSEGKWSVVVHDC